LSAVLVIAGSDPGGSAGLARDLHTLAQLRVPALCVLTAVTVQSDREVSGVHVIPAHVVRAQIEAALSTGRITAVKVGMLATRATVLAVAATLPPRQALPLVVDPVLAASSGGTLLDDAGRAALVETLLPRISVLTPNIPEAAALLGMDAARDEEQLLRQGRALLALGPEAVLLKGGHGGGAHSTDLLLTGAGPPTRFTAARSAAQRRGTGCALASAIAAGLAAGLDVAASCAQAKNYVSALLQQT
jgi:hydroxymethylpyrimidine/phosphomethylpyrimidine kinase